MQTSFLYINIKFGILEHNLNFFLNNQIFEAIKKLNFLYKTLCFRVKSITDFELNSVFPLPHETISNLSNIYAIIELIPNKQEKFKKLRL